MQSDDFMKKITIVIAVLLVCIVLMLGDLYFAVKSGKIWEGMPGTAAGMTGPGMMDFDDGRPGADRGRRGPGMMGPGRRPMPDGMRPGSGAPPMQRPDMPPGMPGMPDSLGPGTVRPGGPIAPPPPAQPPAGQETEKPRTE